MRKLFEKSAAANSPRLIPIEIPDDMLVNIIKSFPQYSPSKPVDFWISTPFSRAVPLLFRNIILWSSFDGISFNFGRNSIYLGGTADYQAMLGVCGRIFQGLEISSNYAGNFEIKDMETLESYFKDATALSFEFNYSDKTGNIELILAASRIFGRRIERLKIQCAYEEMMNPYKRLARTKVLDAIVHSFTKLKSLDYTDQDLTPLSRLWGKIGCTLSKIEVSVQETAICDEDVDITGQWRKFLADVRGHCPNLESISINDPLKDPHVNAEDCIRFLTSYGEQLLEANLGFLWKTNPGTVDPEKLKRIPQLCKNLQCVWREERNYFDRVEALGRILKSLDLEIYGFENWESLISAMNTCVSLEELTLALFEEEDDDFPIDHFRQLFSSQLPFLSKLYISHRTSSEHLKVLISKNVPNALQELHLNRVETPAVKLIPRLIEANPFLKEIDIEEYPTEPEPAIEDTLKILQDLVETFMKCGELLKIYMEFPEREMPLPEDMRNTFVRMRLRKVHYEFVFCGFEFCDGKVQEM